MVHSLAMQGRGVRRASFVVVLGCLPVAALGWMGCGDDDAPATAALGKPDPGGTWGAQVTISVIGRGRVTAAADDRKLDCPSQTCAATII